jgi:hypothetical protein
MNVGDNTLLFTSSCAGTASSPHLVRLCRVLKVGALYNCIHGAGLLAEAAVDALGHVNVVARGAPAPILTLLRLDGDGLCRAHSLTQLACNAALLAGGVAPQRMLATEARADRSLLKGVVDLQSQESHGSRL